MRTARNPSLWQSVPPAGLAFLCLLFLVFPGCKKENPEKKIVAAEQAAGPADLFGKICNRCHQRSEIEGSTSADIQNAIQEVPSMKQLAGTFSEKDLTALEAQLSTTDSGGT
jgi:hypothetical protein